MEADDVPGRVDDGLNSFRRRDVLAHGEPRAALFHPDPLHRREYRTHTIGVDRWSQIWSNVLVK
jgi:hypothetical protein